MEGRYLVAKWIFTLVMVAVALAIYLLGTRLSSLSKYSGATKIFLTLTYAAAIGLILFYPFAILDNFYGIGNEYLTGMALVFLPIGLVLIFVSLAAFLFRVFVNRK